MTEITVRHRRTPQEIAAATLKALLRRQEAKALSAWGDYEQKRDSVLATRHALETLGWRPPEKDTPVLAGGTRPDERIGYCLKSQSEWSGEAETPQSPATVEFDAAGAKERVAARRAVRIEGKPILYAKPVYGACAPAVEGQGPHQHEQVDGIWYCVGKIIEGKGGDQ